jgi:uncharacterized protein
MQVVAINEGEVGRAVRRDSPWWTDEAWAERDRDLRAAEQSGLDYDPSPLNGMAADGLYLLYGPRRVGKTVAIKRTIQRLLAGGVEPLRVVRVSVDGWKANRLGTLHEYVTRVATTSIGSARRYWFIDEITSTQGEWWSVIKDLRDNTAFGDDCVVLTGSSNRNLDEAIKAFAGRRGSALDPDRCLLPMTFRDFCASTRAVDRSISAVRPDELMSDMARDVWQSLVPVTDDLMAAWQAYLEVGGYPKAVSDWRARNHVDSSTWGALWDVVRGEAVTDQVNESAVAAVVDAVSRRLTSTFAVRPTAENLGMRHETLARRIEALIQAFLVWRCPAADPHGRADPGRQSKLYFLDPLVARVPELLVKAAPIDIAHLNEQQLGVALNTWNERARSGSIRSGDWVTHYRSGQAEIDFVGLCADTGERATPLDGKYISGSWKRDALSIRNSAFGRGVLATRDVLSIEPEDPVWAVPASFIAYALADPPS